METSMKDTIASYRIQQYKGFDIEFHSPLPDVKIITPHVFVDERGSFSESFRRDAFSVILGTDAAIEQTNVSHSLRNVIRGLHLQKKNAQGKLVTCVHGEIQDVAVDVRPGSPTFGKVQSCILSDRNHKSMWIPPGYAHGFLAIRESTVMYHCTTVYDEESAISIRWDDPDIGMQWALGGQRAHLSDKDANAPLLKDADL